MTDIEARHGMDRRGFFLVAAALALQASPARADAVSNATALVTSLSAELQKMVRSGQGEASQVAQFQKIISRHADMGPVAASILGQPWRSATEAQKQAFVAAFQSYFARKYGRTFTTYRDATITVTGARDAGKSGVLVSSVVRRPGKENIGVDWQISERGGSPKVVNLIIEGVSMLANERAEVGALLDAQGGSLEGLVAALRAKS